MKKKVQMKKMAGVFLALAIPAGKRVCGCKSGAGRRSGGCSS